MGFPFDVPEDLTALSAEEFAAFIAQVREYAAGQTVGLPAIDNTGRVLATPSTWSGDIFVIRPKSGHRF